MIVTAYNSNGSEGSLTTKVPFSTNGNYIIFSNFSLAKQILDANPSFNDPNRKRISINYSK